MYACTKNLLSHSEADSPTNLNAVKVGSNRFRVSWTPPANVTGYQVYWSVGRQYDSSSVSAGAEDTAVTITAYGRTPGLTYDVTIVALSDHLPSPVVGAGTVALGEPHKCSLYLLLSYLKLDLVALLWHVLISILLYFMPVYSCTCMYSGKFAAIKAFESLCRRFSLQIFSNYL